MRLPIFCAALPSAHKSDTCSLNNVPDKTETIAHPKKVPACKKNYL